MKATIAASAVFYIEMEEKHIAALMELSSHHYDAVCKSASQVGGFVYGWKNCVEFSDNKKATVKATFRELDTSLKIMELAHLMGTDIIVVHQMAVAFRHFIKASHDFLSAVELQVES